MGSKYFFPFAAFLFLFLMAAYFFLNSSYEKSLEAKYYFEMGEYEKAYKAANESFTLNLYNRMASTIMAQSKTAMKYEKYIKEAKQYMQEINAIASQQTISDADRAKMDMMSQIMIDSYIKLAPSVITDQALVSDAKKYYETFEKLHAKINRQ